ncbi:MAG: septum formation initiator family protein [Prevotellaceae bacterium]|jgi:cell division protein FtsB|nr:septum formation initiator family protein [Prevotellaceae bacterium]
MPRTRYIRAILTLFFFAVWIGFFDRNSLKEHITVAFQLHRLEREAAFYQAQVNSSRQRLNDLLTDDDHLEKIAREQYYMKREDEDIFIVED